MSFSEDGGLYDLIVVGGGIAGSVAAAKAAERGLRVLLLEKGNFALGDGNSVMTAGNYVVGGTNPDTPPNEIFERIMSANTARPELARALAQNCVRALDWLRSSVGLVVSVNKSGGVAFEQNSSISVAPRYRIDVGINILKKCRAYYYLHGGSGRIKTRATKLLIDQGNVVAGVEAEAEDGTKSKIKSRATVLATGGFEANKEMLKKYIGKNADRCKLRGSSSATGDGLKMAADVGAKTVNLEYFYGHLLSLKSLTDDRFWPYPRVDNLVDGGILVDRSGKRFLDEGFGDIPLANEVARLNDVASTCLVFDEATWQRATADPLSPQVVSVPNPWLKENDGELYSADTISELASRLHVDTTNLEDTVKQFNAAAENRALHSLAVPRSNHPQALRPPFYGLKVVPGITFTMGGVLVDDNAQVLDKNEKPIGGLYAAGDTIGGLMGGPRGGYTGGVSQALVFGMLAGENAIKQD